METIEQSKERIRAKLKRMEELNTELETTVAHQESIEMAWEYALELMEDSREEIDVNLGPEGRVHISFRC